MQSVQFLSDFDGEWTANEATVVQCAEPVQRHCERSGSIPRFVGVNWEVQWSRDSVAWWTSYTSRYAQWPA
jgi:hypothetical protein